MKLLARKTSRQVLELDYPSCARVNALIFLIKEVYDAISYAQALLMYAAFFFSNMGNYKSFGDTKVVPSLDKVLAWFK